MKIKAKWQVGGVLVLLVNLLGVGWVGAHCQVPCGIYGDQLRAQLMQEHLGTITKSMEQIRSLSASDNPNQVVRWVQNKDDHADKLAHLITYYFMAQRIKPTGTDNKAAHAKYVKELSLLHQLLVTAMKTKQSTDLATVEKGKSLLHAFIHSYFGEAAHPH